MSLTADYVIWLAETLFSYNVKSRKVVGIIYVKVALVEARQRDPETAIIAMLPIHHINVCPQLP